MGINLAYLKREPRVVKHDFNRAGMTVWGRTKSRLKGMPETQYDQLLALPERFPHLEIRRIIVPTLVEIAKINFDELTEDVVRACLSERWVFRGNLLDLRKLGRVLQGKIKADFLREGSRPLSERIDQTEETVFTLIEIIGREREYFRKAAGNPEATVEKVFKALDHGKDKLGFLNVAVYRPLPDGSGKWAVTKRTRNWANGATKYAVENGGAFPQTTLKSIVEGRKAIYDVDIDDLSTFEREGLVADMESIENDHANSKGPGRMLFIKLRSRYGIEAIIHLHNRVSNEEQKEPKSLLPNKSKYAEAIKRELEYYFGDVVWAIEAIRSRGEKLPTTASYRQPFSATLFSDETEETSYLSLKIEVDRNPSLHLAKIKNVVIEALRDLAEKCVGERMSVGEMEAHAIYVNHAEFARRGDKLIAFGTSRYFDNYTDTKGRKEKLTLLSGTMVDPEVRRMGLMIKLNYDLISEAKTAVRNAIRGWLSWVRRIFIPAPMTVRTQSRAVLEACSRHFKGVRRPGLPVASRYQHMTDFVALKEGWKIDGNNVQRDAYTEKRVDSEADLIPGLGEHDAYVFSGDFTLWRELLTKFALYVLYPIKARMRGKKKSGSVSSIV